jgi:hypothetical protein
MKRIHLLVSCLLLVPSIRADQDSAASLSSSLHQLSLDRNEVYHVRDLRFARGDIKIYLTDGYLAFASPVDGRYVAAVFTTSGVETGEAEAVIVPPTRGERASLTYFTKTPNLDEHFSDAAFLFTDDLRAEALVQMGRSEAVKAPEQADPLSQKWNRILRNIEADIEVPLLASLLNEDRPAEGVFYAAIGGKTLGVFDATYDPKQLENTVVGRVSGTAARTEFEVWTSFRARKSPELGASDSLPLASCRIEAEIADDLRVSAITRFQAVPRVRAVRALDFEISPLMKVTGAYIAGQRAEVFQRPSMRTAGDYDVERFLVIAPTPLAPGVPVELEIHHEGAVIQSAGDRVFFVEARNIWFPHRAANSLTFDLTFRSPAPLRVVSSGKLVQEAVDGKQRIVHRVLESPARFVGFNIGEFAGVEQNQAPFHIECFANRTLLDRMNTPRLPEHGQAAESPTESVRNTASAAMLRDLADRAGQILIAYANAWGPPATTNIALTPIPGTFGQGFPGLIYLSSLSYLPEPARPAAARGPMLAYFYSDILLAHEIAHQWWGNLVLPSDYRSGWIVEALANYAAWELFEKQRGVQPARTMLEYYSAELRQPGKGGTDREEKGPIDLGVRLKTTDPEAWRVITYDKGTWIIRMLRSRLGDPPFKQFEKTLAKEFNGRSLSNESLRATAARFLTKSDPDPSLDTFFDAWVYSTGIPHLSLKSDKGGAGEYQLVMTGVGRDFAVDVPLQVQLPGTAPVVKWVRAGSEPAAFTAPPKAMVSLPAPSDFLYSSE